MPLPQVAQGATRRRVPGRRRPPPSPRCAPSRTRRRAARVDAERAFLATLGGGCDRPVAALAAVDGDEIRITGLIASLDGHIVLRADAVGREPLATGEAVARTLLDRDGGRALLADDPAA